MFERLSGWLFFTVFNLLSEQPIPANLVTVRLMTRRYVEALLGHRERETMIAGLWALTGFRQVAVPIAKGTKGVDQLQPRPQGRRCSSTPSRRSAIGRS